QSRVCRKALLIAPPLMMSSWSSSGPSADRPGNSAVRSMCTGGPALGRGRRGGHAAERAVAIDRRAAGATSESGGECIGLDADRVAIARRRAEDEHRIGLREL